jgi:hypothetical protein
MCISTSYSLFCCFIGIPHLLFVVNNCWLLSPVFNPLHSFHNLSTSTYLKSLRHLQLINQIIIIISVISTLFAIYLFIAFKILSTSYGLSSIFIINLFNCYCFWWKTSHMNNNVVIFILKYYYNSSDVFSSFLLYKIYNSFSSNQIYGGHIHSLISFLSLTFQYFLLFFSWIHIIFLRTLYF